MPDLFLKDENATLDYTVDRTAWLGTDTISSSTWVVETGLTKASESHTTTTATVWVSGGTLGQFYDLTNRVTTVGGRTDDRTITVFIGAT